MTWSLRLKIFASWIAPSLFIWLLALGLRAWLRIDSSISALGFFLSVFVSLFANFGSNLPQFYRSTSPSLAGAWKEHIFNSFCAVAFNAALYLIFRELGFSDGPRRGIGEALFNTPLGFCWAYLILFLVSLFTKNPKMTYEPFTKKKLARTFGFIILLYLMIILVGLCFQYSPLIGFVVLAVLICLLWPRDYFASTSLTPSLRRKVVAAGCLISLILGLGSYKISIATDNRLFLGALASREVDWEKAKNLKTVEEWARWYVSADSGVPIDTAIASYIQLESLCQPLANDNAAQVVCAGKEEDSVSINGRWNADEVMKLLASESALVNRIGLLRARSFVPLSADMRALISNLATKQPQLAVLAAHTLSLVAAQKNPENLTIKIRKN
jgi:hypothetical protein